jgi:hypothetical protein
VSADAAFFIMKLYLPCIAMTLPEYYIELPDAAEFAKLLFHANSKIPYLQGQLLVNQELINGRTEQDVKNFAQGVYFVKIANEDGFVVKKLVKE